MYVWCVCVCVCLYVCCIHARSYVWMDACITYVCVYVCMYVCMYACMHGWMCACMSPTSVSHAWIKWSCAFEISTTRRACGCGPMCVYRKVRDWVRSRRARRVYYRATTSLEYEMVVEGGGCT